MTRPFSLATLLLVIFLGLLLPVRAAGLPDSFTDLEADQWLRENIPSYDAWARAVDRRGGYVFTHPQGSLAGNFQDEAGRRCIGLAEISLLLLRSWRPFAANFIGTIGNHPTGSRIASGFNRR